MTIYKHCVGEINLNTFKVKTFDQEQAIRALSEIHDYTINSFVLFELRKPEYRDLLVKNNLAIAKKAVSEAITREQLIIQTINAIEELNRICNSLSKRLREWYGYYFPEITRKIEDNELFVRTIIEKDRNELMKELNIKSTMGMKDINNTDVNIILEYARQIKSIYSQRESLKNYLEDLMNEICPNVLRVSGAIIGAKIIERAGSLKNLSMMPSSTIQVLGAERALFRHLRNKKIKPPKHGIILNHPSVLDSKNRGKAARQLAAKISIASKIDYFRDKY
ncbi:MAG: hypothetical protein KatS3mg002_0034 [Candidatus Woesearchaeota archaeon]|nr:MAG: hypothetical protein KatS3mg002_0034 [Candidatus Woesearchaeota archaeon]